MKKALILAYDFPPYVSLVGIGERAGSGLHSIYYVWNNFRFVRPVLKEFFNPERVSFVVDWDKMDKGSEKIVKSSEKGNKGSEKIAKSSEKGNKGSEKIVKSSEKGNKGSEKIAKSSEKGNKGSEKIVKSSEKDNISSEKIVKSSEKTSSKILKLIDINNKITINELANYLGISTRAIEKQLDNLKNKGFLKRHGSDRGGYWEVKK